jgi:hypothetical protein
LLFENKSQKTDFTLTGSEYAKVLFLRQLVFECGIFLHKRKGAHFINDFRMGR